MEETDYITGDLKELVRCLSQKILPMGQCIVNIF